MMRLGSPRERPLPRSSENPLRLAIMAADLVQTFALPGPEAVIIGRGSGVAIDIPHPAVSPRHARLVMDPVLSIEDLGSAEGTFIEGRRLAPHRPEPLAPGQALSLGTLTAMVVRAAAEPRADEPPPPAWSPVIVDPSMVRVHELGASIAPGNIAVLIVGETGSGKEVLAEAIHRRSRRSDRPFLRVNCAAFADTLVESELFGHEKGSFTGAAQAKPGLLEAAHGGTVLLDEVGEMPRAVQAKLLRVLEEHQVRRVGGLEARPLDLRFISATNRKLEHDVEEGSFRRDLYYRLAGVTLEIPPLRARPREIAAIAQAFLTRAADEGGRPAPRLSAQVLDRLRRHNWPGNVRELRNAIERALLLCPGHEIALEHLPPVIAESPPDRHLPDEQMPATWVNDELQSIMDALDRCAGNQTKAARLLKISRGTLVSRLDAYRLPRPRKSPGAL
jgi:two-component system response regulator AtoC